MGNTVKRLDEIEKCIKEGQFTRAKTLVDRLKVTEVTRSDALRASNLSRRCGKVKKSLKILNPIVRNPQIVPSAKPEEIADYAFSLHRIGASFEAETLLNNIDPEGAPTVHFFKSLIAFSRWEYSRALPWLNDYIANSKLTEYQKLIGRSNRVSIYLFAKEFEKAETEIRALQKIAKEKNLKLLKNLSIEQEAEVLVGQKKYDEAFSLLNRVEREAADSAQLLKMWIWKWKNIIKALKISGKEGLKILNKACEEAVRKGAWEIVRDIDFHKVKLCSDSQAYEKLYFGTPFPHYIERLKKTTSLDLPETYQYFLNSTKEGRYLIDLKNHKILDNDSSRSIEMTEIQWRLMKSLLIDLYRPLKWGEVFNSLFPDEYFDPFSSINRMHQIIFRFNQSLKTQSIDLRIVSNESGCQFLSGSDLGFLIYKDMEDDLYNDPTLREIKKSIDVTQEFTINDICAILDGNIRTHRRWVKKMLAEGKLLKIGQNRSTRYRLVS